MNVIDKIDLKLNESDSGNLLIYESLFYGFYFLWNYVLFNM